MLRRMLEGAEKCALRDLRREQEMPEGGMLAMNSDRNFSCSEAIRILEALTVVSLGHCVGLSSVVRWLRWNEIVDGVVVTEALSRCSEIFPIWRILAWKGKILCGTSEKKDPQKALVPISYLHVTYSISRRGRKKAVNSFEGGLDTEQNKCLRASQAPRATCLRRKHTACL